MRLLLFSDLHRDLNAAKRLVEQAASVDVVVGAGDFGTMRRGLPEVIGVLSAIDRPAVLVPGNSESQEELASACAAWPSARVLHGAGTTIDDVPFWGVGGAIPVTPFGAWSYDFTEPQGRQLLADCPAGGVLVSHSPPHGILDRSSRGASLGSVEVLAAVSRCRPKLVVCGHIHDSSGRSEQAGETVVVNAGPDGVVWEL